MKRNRISIGNADFVVINTQYNLHNMSTISANNNNKSKTETAIENSAISQNNSARIHSSASGNSTTEEKSLVALK